MKFKELVEGKKYTSNNIMNYCYYFIDEGLLCLFNTREDNAKITKLKMCEIARMEFEETPQYVTVQEAFEHMKNGGKSKFYFNVTDMEYVLDYKDSSLDIQKVLMFGYSKKEAQFLECMLEPRWVLL